MLFPPFRQPYPPPFQHRPTKVPHTPRIVSIRFLTYVRKGKKMSTAIAALSPAVSGDQDLSRAVTFTVNGGAPVVVTVPATSLTATTACNPGDVVAAFDIDTNVVGPSLPSPTITATDPFPPPTAVPTTPTVTGISFTDP